ncbi:hypothetical protein DFR68_103715 [Nocardia mexicana]|uniref:Uncharacterized protein n=1 Tax=Nocardia mexicana TaxID=279262 RepID=A0A370HA65_9NOCA|nr:hypothetical protein DFR68_103715 [Nocardia mexicana]
MHSLAIHQLDALNMQRTHQAPKVPFTVAESHTIMQFHVACRAKHCPRKAAALQTLAEAGRLVPSTTKPR